MNYQYKILLLIFLLWQFNLHSQNIISEEKTTGAFPLVTESSLAQIVYDEKDDSLVKIAAGFLQSDINKVTGRKPQLNSSTSSKNIVIIGTVKSKWISQLVKENKIRVDKLKNKWEAYQVEVVETPFKNIEQALVIVGSDRRGTAFGVFELSKQLGVSPWYWWADVPVKMKNEIYIRPNTFLYDAPKVKYRGIFINDEAPALSNWSREKFGGFNHKFYEKVFELMLRLKSNYLWPAMWGNAFYDDDPKNIGSADAYGIVIGTSHHEPLMRAHDEWRRYGKGPWNFDSNKTNLRQFWREGMQRAYNEKIVSIGMRGDGDEPMSRETATSLLERIVNDQRKIIEELTGKPASETPQLWALYKEVQDYYDKGMRVPDDVTLLLCDDNWGNIRRLPEPGAAKRKGGYGIYYHFDYVGGPRNYKWINTNNISRVWEQMNLAYRYGVDRIWIVNVGDIKPMEMPISFFLEQAWDPERWNQDNIEKFYMAWTKEQFGDSYSNDIAELLKTYSQLSSRRKPELLNEKTYQLIHYNEAQNVLKEWESLAKAASGINNLLPSQYHDAYFQLVWHPVQAMANLHRMYFHVAWNKHYAALNDDAANLHAEAAKQYFLQDSLITIQYHTINNGKWNHMMSQTHIGYTYWQQPPFNKLPELMYVSKNEDQLPQVDSTIQSAYDLVPAETGNKAFYEFDGYVSMEASHWTKAINRNKIQWKVIPGIGKTGHGITSFPVTSKSNLSLTSPHVQYEFYTYSKGPAKVQLYFSPTLNLHNNEGLQFAVSIDDEKPLIISLNKDDNNVSTWNQWVANNIIIKTSDHHIAKPGKHIFKYWLLSPAIILQKIVVDMGGVRPSYLGPPETLFEK